MRKLHTNCCRIEDRDGYLLVRELKGSCSYNPLGRKKRIFYNDTHTYGLSTRDKDGDNILFWAVAIVWGLVTITAVGGTVPEGGSFPLLALPISLILLLCSTLMAKVSHISYPYNKALNKALGIAEKWDQQRAVFSDTVDVMKEVDKLNSGGSYD